MANNVKWDPSGDGLIARYYAIVAQHISSAYIVLPDAPARLDGCPKKYAPHVVGCVAAPKRAKRPKQTKPGVQRCDSSVHVWVWSEASPPYSSWTGVKRKVKPATHREILRRHLKKSKYADELRREPIRLAARPKQHPEHVAKGVSIPKRAKRPKQTKQTKQERSQNRDVAKEKLCSAWNHEKNARQAFEGLPGYANIPEKDKKKIAKKIEHCKRDAKGDAWEVASYALLEGENPLKEVGKYLDHERNWRRPITERVGNKKTRVRLSCNNAPEYLRKLPSLRWTGRANSMADDDPHRDTRASDIEWATDSFDGGGQPEDEDFASLEARAEARTPLDDGSDDAKWSLTSRDANESPVKKRAVFSDDEKAHVDDFLRKHKDSRAPQALRSELDAFRLWLMSAFPFQTPLFWLPLYPSYYDNLRELVAPQIRLPKDYPSFRKIKDSPGLAFPEKYLDFVELMEVGYPPAEPSKDRRIRQRINPARPAEDTPEPKTQSRKREVNPFLQALIGGKG